MSNQSFELTLFRKIVNRISLRNFLKSDLKFCTKSSTILLREFKVKKNFTIFFFFVFTLTGVKKKFSIYGRENCFKNFLFFPIMFFVSYRSTRHKPTENVYSDAPILTSNFYNWYPCAKWLIFGVIERVSVFTAVAYIWTIFRT